MEIFVFTSFRRCLEIEKPYCLDDRFFDLYPTTPIFFFFETLHFFFFLWKIQMFVFLLEISLIFGHLWSAQATALPDF